MKIIPNNATYIFYEALDDDLPFCPMVHISLFISFYKAVYYIDDITSDNEKPEEMTTEYIELLSATLKAADELANELLAKYKDEK